MGFGNVVITERDSTVELTLNTHVGKGHPHALFTPREIPKLCEVLMTFANKKPVKVVPVEEDDDDELEDIL